MSLKAIADQWEQRQTVGSCIVASPRECNRATFAGASATSHATSMQSMGLKAICRAKTIATYRATSVQLGIKNDATFDAISGAKNTEKLHAYPAVWQVQLRTGERVYTMTVIDPDRMPDDQFIRYLNEKFGADRILTTCRKAQGNAA